jgi:hypothetical protein
MIPSENLVAIPFCRCLSLLRFGRHCEPSRSLVTPFMNRAGWGDKGRAGHNFGRLWSIGMGN